MNYITTVLEKKISAVCHTLFTFQRSRIIIVTLAFVRQIGDHLNLQLMALLQDPTGDNQVEAASDVSAYLHALSAPPIT